MKQHTSENWRTLLLRWISGDATRSDERKLDSLAEDDPFLADALEGYRSAPEVRHAETVTRIKSKLRRRTEVKKRGVVFYFTRIAAVGALLLASWWVFQFAWNNSQQGEISLVEAPAPEADRVRTDTASPYPIQPAEERMAEIRSTEEVANVATPPTEYDVTPPPVPGPKMTESVHFSADREEERIASESNNLKSVLKKKSMKNDPSPEIVTRPNYPEPEAMDLDLAYDETERKMAGNASPFRQTITGQVTSPDGKPLPGASVATPDNRQKVVTDKEGLFTLVTDLVRPSLEVSYAGYEEKEVQSGKDEFLYIQLDALDPETAASEADGNKSTGHTDVSPKEGFEAFERYIFKNAQKPLAKENAGSKTQVEVSFKIDAKGRPYGLKVIRSTNSGWNEEAIRLMKEGPDWTGPTDRIASYLFVFPPERRE